jgi:hypothetical protein
VILFSSFFFWHLLFSIELILFNLFRCLLDFCGGFEDRFGSSSISTSSGCP